MKPAPFTYHRASSASEAVAMLASAGEEASVLAGGQSLVPLMNFRVAQPAHLVDINYVDELDYIRLDDGWLAIGARTRQAAVERSEEVARAAPLITEALGQVAHPPVRHRGTSSGASSTPTRPRSSRQSSSRSRASWCSAGPTASAASRRASSSPARS